MNYKKTPFRWYLYSISGICDTIIFNQLGNLIFYWINEKLTLAGWEMKVEESSGSLFGTRII